MDFGLNGNSENQFDASIADVHDIITWNEGQGLLFE